MKKINYKIIKQNFIYTILELAMLLRVHRDTVRVWIRQGLPIVKGTKNPILIKGSEAKSFLKNREKSRKCKLKDDQFYCMKCRTAQTADTNSVWIEILNDELSPGNRKTIIHGKCNACGTEMLRFSSEKIAQKWLNQGWVNKDNLEPRYNVDKPAINTQVTHNENTVSRRTK